MKVGDWVDTPRFCKVRIKEMFESKEDALKAGYREPTHYERNCNDGYGILGKSLDMYHMVFAAYLR